MAIYVNKKPTDDGSIKFYCPVKSENFVFILKFKMKICESRPSLPSSFPTVMANRVASALDTSMSHMAPSSSNIIPAIRGSMEIEPKMSYQENSNLEYPNSNSSPNFFVSNPMNDTSSNATRRRKRNEFQLSQEHDYKKSKLNSVHYEEETPISVHLDKRPLPDLGSRSNSFSNGFSTEIKMIKETSNMGIRTIKQEHILRGDDRIYEEYEYRGRADQQRTHDKNDIIRHGKIIQENGRNSMPKSDSRYTAVNSGPDYQQQQPQYQQQHQQQQQPKRVLFDGGPRMGGFLGKDMGN